MDTGAANAGLPRSAKSARFDNADSAMPALPAAAAAIARARPTELIRAARGNHG